MENSVNRLAWYRVDMCLQFVKNTVSVKHNKAKCKIKRYACTYFTDVHPSRVAVLVVKNPLPMQETQEMRVRPLGEEDPLEEGR